MALIGGEASNAHGPRLGSARVAAGMLLAVALVGCRASSKTADHSRDATAAVTTQHGTQPGQPTASAAASLAPPTHEDARNLAKAVVVHETVDFATCRRSEADLAESEQEQGDGLIRCTLSPGLLAQQDGSACLDINRLRTDNEEDLFSSELITPQGTLFVPDRKFELYRCQGVPFAVLQSGQFFTDTTSAESPCHAKKPLRRAYLVQDIRNKKRYDDVTLKRSQTLLAQIERSTPCSASKP